jgi:hypothetical protein
MIKQGGYIFGPLQKNGESFNSIQFQYLLQQSLLYNIIVVSDKVITTV